MVLGRAYTVTMDAISISAAKDIVELAAPATMIASVSKIEVTQETQTSSEALAIQVHRSAATGTGTAVTARPTENGGPAAAVTAKVNHTVDTTPGNILYRGGWNVLTPFILHFTPEEEFTIPPSGFLVVRLEVAPGAAMTISATVHFREIG